MAKTKILVVEDENIIAMNIKNKLKGLGYDVVATVPSGEKAIQKVEETHPDLALMDIKLKGDMDGVQAAEQICSRFNIPVIYLTAYSDDNTLQRAKLSKPYGYLLKPVKEKELHAAIEMALYQHKMEEELTKHRDHLEEMVKERTAELFEANRALIESEEKYRSIFENAAEGIFQTTLDGRYLTANPMLAKIFGYESPDQLIESIINLDAQFYVEPTRRDEFIRLMQEKDSLSDFKSQVYRRDGSLIWISENIRTLRDDNGKLLGFEGTTVDITKRKQTEEKLISRNKELESFNEVTVGRELKMIELKKEINELLEKSGEKPKYKTII